MTDKKKDQKKKTAKAKNAKPFLSVIIPTLNEEHYISGILSDLSNQTYQDFEVIVADSSSDDDTLKVAKTFNKKLQLKTTTVVRKSAGHGRNGGAKKARGAFLLFLDADARIKPYFLEVLVNQQKSLQADVLTTHIRASGWNPIDRLTYFIDSRAFKQHFKRGRLVMTGCVQFVRASLFKKVGGYNADMKVGEDIDFARRLGEKTKKFAFVSSLKVKTSNRRFKTDGRLAMLLRHFYWVTGLKVGGSRMHSTKFGHYKPQSKLWRITGAAGLSLFWATVAIWVIGSSYAFVNRNQPTTFGASFSAKYAEELGINWEETLKKSARELNIDHYRLMSYWDRMQPEQATAVNTSELDTQLEILASNNKTATVVVGLRQPRWPECHSPMWLSELNTEQQQKAELTFIETIVNQYESNPTVTSWQLENEAANRNFGECPAFDRDFYRQKYELLRNLSTKPISINASNQSGWPLRKPVGEGTGFSIYKEAYFDAFGRRNAWSFWYIQSWWHGFRAAMVELQHSTESFVHELQTEPWGPEATINLTPAQQAELFTPDELERNIRFARQTGMHEIWLWGVEWWYLQADEYNNPAYLERLNSIIWELSAR